jgi:hypothetical protein
MELNPAELIDRQFFCAKSLFMRKSLFLRHAVCTPRYSGNACSVRRPRNASPPCPAIHHDRRPAKRQCEAPPRQCYLETLVCFDVSSEHRKATSKIFVAPSKESRREPFAAAGAPRRDNLAASHGGHPGTKPMPALTHKLAWLVGPLHRAAPIMVPITQ